MARGCVGEDGNGGSEIKTNSIERAPVIENLEKGLVARRAMRGCDVKSRKARGSSKTCQPDGLMQGRQGPYRELGDSRKK